MDLLRRRLAHEQRLVLVRGGPYATVGEPMTLFIERCERLLTENDATMVDHFASLTNRQRRTSQPEPLVARDAEPINRLRP